MYELKLMPPREQPVLDDTPFALWRSPDGEVAATFHRRPEGYLVRFVDRADFSVELGVGQITCWPFPGKSPAGARDLYLNQIVPMIRGHQGELVLHASGVALGGAAAAFVAPTGRGKSTLAAAFARAGMPFLSDDGLVLTAEAGRYVASPNRPSFRLWSDSEAVVIRGEVAPEEDENEKSRVEAGELPFQEEPLPLRALYFLGLGETARISIARLPIRETLAELIDHSFFLDAEDKGRMKRHFEALARLAETVPAFALDYPRDYAGLPSLIAAVSRHMDELGGTSSEAD
jgi:hypothetical protein